MSVKGFVSSFFRYFNIKASVLYHFKTAAKKYISGQLVDIGCGRKQKMYMNLVTGYTGVDHPDALKSHKNSDENIDELGVDVFASADKLPFDDQRFDCAICYNVLEHLSEPDKALSEAARVLKKGGYYTMIVPFMHRIHSKPWDFFRYTEYGLRYLLEKNGFKIVEFKSSGGFFLTLASRLSGYLYSDLLGFGYRKDERSPHHKWFLVFAPVVIPLIFLLIPVLRIFDKIHKVDTDPLYYYVVSQKQ